MAFSKEELENPGEDIHFLINEIENKIKFGEIGKVIDIKEKTIEIILSYPPYIMMRNQKEFHEYLKNKAYEKYKRRIEKDNYGNELTDWYTTFKETAQDFIKYYFLKKSFEKTL